MIQHDTFLKAVAITYKGTVHAVANADDGFGAILRMQSNVGSTTRIDSDRLQREAKELLELSQSLQPDMQHVKQGLLPKDTVRKLKRIENLSKHLRGELHQIGVRLAVWQVLQSTAPAPG